MDEQTKRYAPDPLQMWFIDIQNKTKEEVVRYYSVNGKKDNNGNVIEGTSLKRLVSYLPDFKEELTLLQFRAHQLGVEIDCSPKYHPEIAGEGIEYCWGLSKNTYRAYPLKDKKTREKFKNLVSKSIDVNNILTKERIRLFARRQRRYILAYLSLEHCREHQQNPQQDSTPKMSCSLVERLVKKYKSPKQSHRNILDSETRFLNDVVALMKKSAIEPLCE